MVWLKIKLTTTCTFSKMRDRFVRDGGSDFSSILSYTVEDIFFIYLTTKEQGRKKVVGDLVREIYN